MTGKVVVDKLRLLTPKSDAEAEVKAQVLGLVGGIYDRRNGSCF